MDAATFYANQRAQIQRRPIRICKKNHASFNRTKKLTDYRSYWEIHSQRNENFRECFAKLVRRSDRRALEPNRFCCWNSIEDWIKFVARSLGPIVRVPEKIKSKIKQNQSVSIETTLIYIIKTFILRYFPLRNATVYYL